MLSSGISSSVQAFKTEGPKVAQAISTLGETATSAGASIAEQFAVLGMLSASKEGGEAATKYKRFIEGAGAAGEKLGLSFLDANNNLLPTIDILKRIKQHYGDLDTLEIQEIRTAFGSSEAKDFVEKFIPMIDELDQSIGNMQTNLQGGMATTNKMASDILLGGPNESFNQMGNRFNNLAVMVGEIFAPALMGVVDVLGIVAIGAQELINTFPMASKFILYGAGAFVALKMAIIAGRTAMLAWNAANMLSLTTTNAYTAATSRMGIVQTALKVKTGAVTAAQWLWNAALNANPIGLVITAVGALIGIAAYLVDDWSAVGQWLLSLWDDLKQLFWDGLEAIKTVFSYSPMFLLFQHWQPLLGFFEGLWGSIKTMFLDAWQWIQDSIIGPIMAIKGTLGAAWNKLFGDDEKTVEVTQKVKQISDQAINIAKDSPSVAKKIVQPKPLTTQSGINQNNHYQVTINIDKPNASPEEINRAVAKAMDDHQRKNARSIRGNLND